MARGRGNRAINHGSILSVVGKFLIGIEGKKKKKNVYFEISLYREKLDNFFLSSSFFLEKKKG